MITQSQNTITSQITYTNDKVLYFYSIGDCEQFMHENTLEAEIDWYSRHSGFWHINYYLSNKYITTYNLTILSK